MFTKCRLSTVEHVEAVISVQTSLCGVQELLDFPITSQYFVSVTVFKWDPSVNSPDATSLEGGGGGGGRETQQSDRLRSEVQTLTLSYTLHRK